MKKQMAIAAKIVRKAAEHSLRRDANSTTCVSIYQPKVPADLKRFKSSK